MIVGVDLEVMRDLREMVVDVWPELAWQPKAQRKAPRQSAAKPRPTVKRQAAKGRKPRRR